MTSIENATEKLLRSTKKSTVDTAKRNYSKAVLFADKSNLDALKEINKQCLLSVQRSKNRRQQTRNEEQRANRIRKIKIFFYTSGAVAVVVALLYLFISYKINHSIIPEQFRTEQTFVCDSLTIASGIEAYCTQKDTTLSDWRKGLILNDLLNKELTTNEIILNIDSIATK